MVLDNENDGFILYLHATTPVLPVVLLKLFCGPIHLYIYIDKKRHYRLID